MDLSMDKKQSRAPTYQPLAPISATIRKAALKPQGQAYEAIVPDTLDLADRARLAVNVLTRNIEPTKYYAVYQVCTLFTRPPQGTALTWNITVKNVRTLPVLRVMCGSEQNLDTEYNMMHTLLSQIEDDGAMCFPFGGDGAPKGTAYPMVSGLMALAVLNWQERDNDAGWTKWHRLLCENLCQRAIQVDDRAYYPPECGWHAGDGAWLWTSRGQPLIPYQPPDEPVTEQQGFEGSVKYEQAQSLRALVKNALLNFDTASLEMARKIARFCLKSTLWDSAPGEKYPGSEHGAFSGHLHGNLTCLLALLDLALADNDDRLKQFVREGYEHARSNGVVRMGWFPCWILPNSYNRDPAFSGINEPCALSDMVLLAVKLSDAGLGDYWDDVDYMVRNHLTEMQICDLDLMRQAAGVGPEHDDVLGCFLGGFGDGGPTGLTRGINGCCSANGAMGLYYAWHGITRFDEGIATVNLFLNRAAHWMDIDSYLPYEGKVVLRNKKAHTVLVRMPCWVNRSKVKCTVNERNSRCALAGNYLVFSDLHQSDEIRLEFPLPASTDTYTINGNMYTIDFRGSTVVDIQPRIKGPKVYPYYLRDHFKADTVPMRKVQRFVTQKIIPLQ